MLNQCQSTDSNLIKMSLNTELKIEVRRNAILKICELEKAHTLAMKKRSTENHFIEQSFGVDDEKIMDPKPPNPTLCAGAGYGPTAEESSHGT